MYTLRKIVEDVQHNQNLGNNYQVVERETNYDEFCKAFKVAFQTDHVADLDDSSTEFTKNCYAIIFAHGGSETIPLYKNQFNYIMTESGKTFSNLTYNSVSNVKK